MCEAGRILHHLREGVEDQRNTILIVGFQAQHTLGRRIVERQREVKVFGVMRRLAAEVVVLNGFSAHADQKDLLEFAEAVRDQGKLRQVVPGSWRASGASCAHGQAGRARIPERDRPRPQARSSGSITNPDRERRERWGMGTGPGRSAV
jgi:Cft2 family RNA processing exonuclease